MRPFHGVVLALFLISQVAAAQTSSQPAPSPSDESDWIPRRALGVPGRAVKAPARALGKLFKRSGGPPPSAGEAESTGVVANEQLQASGSSLGAVFILNTSVGYAFTPHFTAEAGLPIFFTRSPFSPVTNKDWRWTTWILGDPYLDVRYKTNLVGSNFTTVLTGTFPVSNPRQIYSTGRFGVDWFNHVEKSYKGLTPFVNFGAANGTVNRFVMPRPYSIARPYQTLGFISDFEGGLSYRYRHTSFGVSAYALVPGGPQKIFSRLVAPDYALAGEGTHNRLFDTAFEVIGNSQIAQDHGFSGWVEITRVGHTTLQLGYTHSIRYALDSLTLMLNFDGSFLFREPKE